MIKNSLFAQIRYREFIYRREFEMSMKCTALSFLVGSVVGAAAVIATVPGTKSFMKRTMKKGKRALEDAVCNMW